MECHTKSDEENLKILPQSQKETVEIIHNSAEVKTTMEPQTKFEVNVEIMNESEEETPVDSLRLDLLPTEILMYICDFVDAKTIIKSLCKVCQAFQLIFSGDVYWKLRIFKRWPEQYPAVSVDDFDWKEGCIAREDYNRKWQNPEEYYHHISYSAGLFAAVDAVHLMKNGSILAAGSRDRYLTVLNLDRYDSDQPVDSMKDMLVYSDRKEHTGWIWSLASVDNQLATGSWDTFIKLWDVDAGCESISKFKCKSAVLSLYMEPGFIAAGSYDKCLNLIDPRDGKVDSKRLHRQPVLCVAGDDKYIITGSEDKTIKIYDRRAGSLYKTVKLEDCYPLDLNYGDNQLWFGDKTGNLHLINTTHGDFNMVATYDVGHTGKLTGVQRTPGSIFTSSSDNTIKVLQPTLNPTAMTTLKHHDGDVAGISYQNGILASAGCDISIGIWLPK